MHTVLIANAPALWGLPCSPGLKLPRLLFASLYFCVCPFSAATGDDHALIARVLAEPTSVEVFGVLQSLKELDLTPRDFAVHASNELANGNTLQVISHESECGVHYAAVITPAGSRKNTPVVVFAAGGDGMNTNLDISTDFSHQSAQYPAFLGEPLDSQFMVVVPSFRGQALVVDGKKHQSAGTARDAFVGAATDTIALLNVVLKNYQQADAGSIGIYGGSRGGAVALLAAARDERIKRAVVVATPADMEELYRLYPEQFKMLFFDDLLAGRISERSARREFIACSPIHFSERIPLLQLHHDKRDPFVPVGFAHQLLKKLRSQGKEVDANFYDEGVHGFPSSPDYWERVCGFFKPLLSD